jgi:DNA-binding winged helix-turn-helix (wHTH) protein/Tol biopolymer transport system component
MTEHKSLVFRFDDVEVREREFLLIKAGEALPVEPKAFRVLLFLLRNPGRLVTKDEVLGAVWNDCAASDNSLTRSIATLRRLLGDDTHEPRYIATVPTVGYRFLCDVKVTTNGFAGAGSPQTGAEEVDGGGYRLPAPVSGPASTAVLAAGVGPPLPPGPIASSTQPALAGASTRKPLRWLHILFIAISLVTVGAGAFWFFNHRPTTNHQHAEQRVTFNSPEAAIQSAVVSPDGKYLAYSDPTGLYLRHVATGETRRWSLPKDFIAHANGWFPDGTHLLVMRLEGPMHPSLWKLSLLGASPRKLIDNAGRGSVSPDGSRIAFLTAPDWGRELWVMSSDGSNPHKIAAAGQTEQFSSRENQIFPFVWSPDGQRVAYIERHTAPTASPADDVLFSLATRDANGGDLQVILNDNRLRHALAWAPDGRILFAYREDPSSDRGDEGVRSIRVDQQTGKATGELQFLTNGSGSIGWMSVSSDGMRLVLSRNNTQVQSFVAEYEADTRKWKTPRLLTLDANNNAAEAWLPDNRTVLFVSNRNGRWTLFKQPMDETTAEVLVEQRCISLPRLSADGSQVLYQLRTCPVNFLAPVSLMRLPIAGGPPRLVLKQAGILNYQCARLPSTLCIFSKVQGTDHVYVSFDPERGIGRELLRTKGSFNNWSLSSDGRTLAVFPGDHRIRFFSVQNGVAREGNTVILNDWWIPNGDWSADGKGVLIPSVTPSGTPVMLEVDRAGKASVVLEGAANTAFMWMIPSPDGRFGILDVEVPGDNNVWMVDRF